jgi:D-glycero-alpha-D-manno-heptose 1-phosphate guanylyltransferase
MTSLSKITAVVLVGGKGKRLGDLYPKLPKPLVPAFGKPFLHWVTAWLIRQGVRDIVYSTGHLAGQIESWVDGVDFGSGVRLRYRREMSPLGTGGGIAHCLDLCSDPVLVLNGDSLVLAPVALLAARLDDEEKMDGVIRGVVVDDAARYGSLEVGPDGLLHRIAEKRLARGLINGGVYLMRRRFFSNHMPPGPSSFENDVLPKALAGGAQIAVEDVARAPFLDIGTPESVVLAEAFIENHCDWFEIQRDAAVVKHRRQ